MCLAPQMTIPAERIYHLIITQNLIYAITSFQLPMKSQIGTLTSQRFKEFPE